MILAILASWNLIQAEEVVGIATTHYLYLEYAAKMYDEVYLVSPLIHDDNKMVHNAIRLQNVKIVPLPYCGNYVGALKEWKSYYRALQKVCDKVDIVYCRVPDPFSWMPTLLFRKKTIMHFVGDTIDATQHNERWSGIKKMLMIAGYLPDYWLTLQAAKRSKVYTNGRHLSDKLRKHHINATPVISSTVSEKSLHNDFKPLPIKNGFVTITYVGYIRFAKGMNCLMSFCKQLRAAGVHFRFNIVGDGEMFSDVKEFVVNEELSDCVKMYGHIDNKDEMNRILRDSDLFFFPSISEGSPRVVIEAMAQGVPVLSTPVGSLPGTFKDGETIRFFGFNDVRKAVSLVDEYMRNPAIFDTQRQMAYCKVAEQFTIEIFLSKVFSYEA